MDLQRSQYRTATLVQGSSTPSRHETDSNYELSSAVAMAVLGKLPAVDAIVFSSRRQHGAGNFAVRGDRLWRDWGVIAVQEAHARHLAMSHYRLRQARHVTNITGSGALIWSDDSPDDVEAMGVLDPPWHTSR